MRKIALGACILALFMLSAGLSWDNSTYLTRYHAVVNNSDFADYSDYPVNINIPFDGNMSEILVICDGSNADFGHLDALSGTDINFRVNVPANSVNDSCYVYFNATENVSDQSSMYEPINWQFWYNFSEHAGDWQDDWRGDDSWHVGLLANLSMPYFMPEGEVAGVIDAAVDSDLFSENGTRGIGTKFFEYAYGEGYYGYGLVYGDNYQPGGRHNATARLFYPAAYGYGVPNSSFFYTIPDDFDYFENTITSTCAGATDPYYLNYNESLALAPEYMKMEYSWLRNGSMIADYYTHNRSSLLFSTRSHIQSCLDSGYFGLANTIGDGSLGIENKSFYAAFGWSDLAENMSVTLSAPEQYALPAKRVIINSPISWSSINDFSLDVEYRPVADVPISNCTFKFNTSIIAYPNTTAVSPNATNTEPFTFPTGYNYECMELNVTCNADFLNTTYFCIDVPISNESATYSIEVDWGAPTERYCKNSGVLKEQWAVTVNGKTFNKTKEYPCEYGCNESSCRANPNYEWLIGGIFLLIVLYGILHLINKSEKNADD